MKKTLLSWSSGKDSAYALHTVLRERRFEVVGLLTTVTDPFQRVSMHGVREELLDRQAEAVGLPLIKIRIPSPCPNILYEETMSEVLKVWKGKGVSHVIFGDLFLEDLRKYREEKLSLLGMEGVFPIWQKNTRPLAETMIREGFRAVSTCVDPRKLPKDFAGRRFDESLLRDFPPGIDPCGENGEFHSFLYDGPIFSRPIGIRPGEIVERDGFVFADFLPES